MMNISLKVIILSALLGVLYTNTVLAASASPSDAYTDNYNEVDMGISDDEENTSIEPEGEFARGSLTLLSTADGWVVENGKWYYYIDGEKVTGWLKVDGYYYYMDSTGAMLTDCYTPDGYYVGSDGRWIEDYQNGSSSSVTTPTDFDISGWVVENGNWYYYIDGEKVTGWLKVDGYYYYMDSTGAMLTNCYTPDGYYVGSDGRWVEDYQSGSSVTPPDDSDISGWVQIGDDYYYYVNGLPYTGWIYDTDGNWYYCGKGGILLRDTTTPDGYLVDANGAWIRDGHDNSATKVTDGGTSGSSNGSSGSSKRSSGSGGGGGGGSSSKSVATGSSSTAGGPAAGYTTEGTTLLDGSWETLEDGHMKFVGTDGVNAKSQWILINDNYYFTNPDGIMVTGWQIIDNNWYYFDPVTGIMLHDTVTPDGYSVGSDGAWIQE